MANIVGQIATSFIVHRGWAAARSDAKPTIPWFLLGFFALVTLNILDSVSIIESMNEVSRWCLVTAIAALGIKTSFKSLVAVGWRPVAVMMVETAWIGGLVMALFMTLFIQRATHRDTQAIQAKLDELLRVHGEASNALMQIDEREPEEIVKMRDAGPHR